MTLLHPQLLLSSAVGTGLQIGANGAFKSCRIHRIYELNAHERHHKVVIMSGKLKIFFKPRVSELGTCQLELGACQLELGTCQLELGRVSESWGRVS